MAVQTEYKKENAGSRKEPAFKYTISRLLSLRGIYTIQAVLCLDHIAKQFRTDDTELLCC